ncbi:MAG: GTP cyclohydrolase-2 [Bacteroidetes bacterium OLB9]|nr:MAG: GTP cyclohydrolase-2 [Bacteroidetes bacterium OLB9]
MFNRQSKAYLPTKWGEFFIYTYAENHEEQQPHFALVHKDVDIQGIVPVRIHSECLTGDLLGSVRCDCGEQFNAAMDYISQHPGVMIYLRQEGRGIGLNNKLDAYNLQDKGYNTIEANVHLGFEPDERDFEIAIFMLKDLGISRIDLLTNNPEKLATIENSDILLNSRIPLVMPSRIQNKNYLQVKKDKMGHLLM